MTTEELVRWARARAQEPSRPVDAEVHYGDGYEAGQRNAFEEVARVLEGDRSYVATARTWLERT